jgi:hypothetical protein
VLSELREKGRVQVHGLSDADPGIELSVAPIPVNPGVHEVAELWINR